MSSMISPRLKLQPPLHCRDYSDVDGASNQLSHVGRPHTIPSCVLFFFVLLCALSAMMRLLSA